MRVVYGNLLSVLCSSLGTTDHCVGGTTVFRLARLQCPLPIIGRVRCITCQTRRWHDIPFLDNLHHNNVDWAAGERQEDIFLSADKDINFDSPLLYQSPARRAHPRHIHNLPSSMYVSLTGTGSFSHFSHFSHFSLVDNISGSQLD